jgi:hypothetical protein
MENFWKNQVPRAFPLLLVTLMQNLFNKYKHVKQISGIESKSHKMDKIIEYWKTSNWTYEKWNNINI